MRVSDKNHHVQTMQVFICTWRGHEDGAVRLHNQLHGLAPVTVINTDPDVRSRHRDWIHLDPSAFFAEQWNCACRRFDADLLFQVQADAEIQDAERVIARARECFARHPVGAYEPLVDYTDIQYDRTKLAVLDDETCIVPWTDSTCWCIDGNIVRNVPPFDLSANRYGWGICRAVAAIARLSGRICVRDHGVFVRHPQRRGYPSNDAMAQMRAYLRGFPVEVQGEVARLESLRDTLRPRVVE
jgi:hypothetical protein